MPGGKKRTGDEFVFAALGGIGEIGMNVYLYGFGPPDDRKWLMVDLGVTFAGEQEPGVDLILPDLRFIEEDRSALLGILLTHAHEDHFGAVVDLWPRLKAPVYATPFTAGLLRAKLAENGKYKELPIREIPLKARFDLGPFVIELINVAHSIPEPNALAIRTRLGTVVHTADWKIDPDPITGSPTDVGRLKEIGKEGVLALICDSTNALREGVSPSEAEIGNTIKSIVREAKGAVAVTAFASNVARIRSIAEAAEATGRQLVVAGRAMKRILDVSQETGYVPRDMRVLDQQSFADIPRPHVLALITGSQGEPRAALARIAAGEHPDIELTRGDTVIYSCRTIPGNEKAVGRIQNALADRGVRLVTDSDALVHVTGHPRRGELRQIYEWCRPALAVPMHGEPRHLEEHVRLALACGVKQALSIRNGQMVRLSPGVPEVIDEVPVGRIFRDGHLLVSSEEGSVRDRRKLSYVGVVVVSAVISRNGEVAADPQVEIDGIPVETADGRDMAEEVLVAVEGALDSIPKGKRRDAALVRDALQRAARAAVNEAWGKRPICKVLVSVV